MEDDITEISHQQVFHAIFGVVNDNGRIFFLQYKFERYHESFFYTQAIKFNPHIIQSCLIWQWGKI